MKLPTKPKRLRTLVKASSLAPFPSTCLTVASDPQDTLTVFLCATPALLASFQFPKHVKLIPTPRPLHLLSSLPGMLFFLIFLCLVSSCHFDSSLNVTLQRGLLCSCSLKNQRNLSSDSRSPSKENSKG